MSTPSGPELQPSRPALEPTQVLRRRPPGALAELVRQANAAERDREEKYEAVAVPAADPTASAGTTEDDAPELPPIADEEGSDPLHPVAPAALSGRAAWLRRTAVVVAVMVAALAGFGAALLLTWDRDAEDAAESQARPPGASAAPPGRSADPDGAGTLREGDSGPEVSDLQERLLRIPDVYQDGASSGVYDATLAAAVARFQLWYGIRGDETGVYGNDTRHDLESRTAPTAPHRFG